MLAQVLDPSSYAFSSYSVPTLITTLAILSLGLFALVRERISLVSISSFVLTVAVSMWLCGFS